MKLKTIAIIGLAALDASAGTTAYVSNFNLIANPRKALPIVDIAGHPIAMADSTIQIGTFADDFAAILPYLSVWDHSAAVIDAFMPSGPAGSLTFDGLFSVAMETDETGALGDAAANNGAYVLINFTPPHGVQTQSLVFSLGQVFPKQDGDGNAELKLERILGFDDIVFGASTTPSAVDTSSLPEAFGSFDVGIAIGQLSFPPKQTIPDLDITHDGGTIFISWEGDPGTGFQVEYSDDLEHWFRDLPNSHFFNSAMAPLPFTFNDTSGATGRYYRVTLSSS